MVEQCSGGPVESAQFPTDLTRVEESRDGLPFVWQLNVVLVDPCKHRITEVRARSISEDDRVLVGPHARQKIEDPELGDAWRDAHDLSADLQVAARPTRAWPEG